MAADLGVRVRLVDIVADVHDQVGGVGDDVPIGGEEPLLVVLAADQCELQPIERGAVLRRRLGTADGTADVSRCEAIPVFPAGLQPLGFYVNRVRPLRGCVLDSSPDYGAHAIVARQLPFDRHHLGRHTSARGARLGREPRPKDNRRGARIARCNTERERIRSEPTWRCAGAYACARRCASEGKRCRQKLSTCLHWKTHCAHEYISPMCWASSS